MIWAPMGLCDSQPTMLCRLAVSWRGLAFAELGHSNPWHCAWGPFSLLSLQPRGVDQWQC